MVRALVMAATACHALLAGVGIDRLLVRMPAWRRTGTRDWAAYSRNADLTLPAAALYPSAAFAGAACTIAAAALAERDERTPLWIASTFAVLGLLATAGAAPNMLRLRRPADLTTLERSFRGFHRWGNVRAVMQTGALAANLLALSAR
jgi:hypothetical protein